MATQNDKYQEIGIVVAVADDLLDKVTPKGLDEGNRVYFDSWLAAKYPNKDGGTDAYYWLVKWEDVRAVEYVEPE